MFDWSEYASVTQYSSNKIQHNVPMNSIPCKESISQHYLKNTVLDIVIITFLTIIT